MNGMVESGKPQKQTGTYNQAMNPADWDSIKTVIAQSFEQVYTYFIYCLNCYKLRRYCALLPFGCCAGIGCCDDRYMVKDTRLVIVVQLAFCLCLLQVQRCQPLVGGEAEISGK
jgi:hypothetical protein